MMIKLVHRRLQALLTSWCLSVCAMPALGTTPAAACFRDATWDGACLRALYQGAPASWPRPSIDVGVAWQEMGLVPEKAPEPVDNPSSPTKVDLGRQLFFDPRLSRQGSVACASCHMPARSFTDGRIKAVGEDKMMGRRRTPTLFAAPFAPSLFWDGRAVTLEEQVLGPIQNPFEMNHALADVVSRLEGLPEYRASFAAAFGTGALSSGSVAKALAAFVRTIRPEPGRFTQFLSGQTAALTDQEVLGLHLFRTKARCMNCHSGPLLSDMAFHDLGLSFYGGRNQDLGRFEVTRDKADLGHFRTPSLWGVSKAGPWMHNGIFPQLLGVVNMYNGGMGTVTGEPDDPYLPKKSPLIKKLNLTPEEIKALTAWLSTL